MDPSLKTLVDRLDSLSDEFRELREGVRRAILVAELDPEMALTRARKVLEYVIRDVYERRVKEPAGTRPFENLLQRLVKDKFLPDRLDAYANTIRKLGNVGTHTFGEKITVADVNQSLGQLTVVLEWYFDHERPDTSQPTAKGLRREKAAEDRAAPPPGKPAVQASGKARAILLTLAGLLLVVGCGAVYWAVSGANGRSDSSRSNFSTEDIAKVNSQATGRSASSRSDSSVDAVAKVKNVSGIDLVSIPAGEFYMGSPESDQDAEKDEKPQHKVKISQPFYLGKYHVTVGQFQRFVDATGHTTEAEKEGDKWTWKKPGFQDTAIKQTAEHPVVCVSANDADAYCRWLAQKTGAKSRLPYESEWEYSCRAQPNTPKDKTTKYYFGNDVAALEKYAWCDSKGGYGTKPCGGKEPNKFGLYDMHGLAWEWCADGKREYPKNGADETDPVGPSAGASRVRRGGSWSNIPRNCRAACRDDFAPTGRSGLLGFRVLLSR